MLDGVYQKGVKRLIMNQNLGKYVAYAAAWLASVIVANDCRAAEYLADTNYFGAFTSESQAGSSGCASLDSKVATVGMPVNIVVLSKPQRLLQGTIKSEASAGCTRYFQASDSAAFYEVGIARGKFEPHELGVLVLPGATVAKTRSGEITAALGERHYRFFECSSREGIHLGVGSAMGQRQAIWHDYIYLGIDVEPTCRKADYLAIETLTKAFNRGRVTHAR